MCWERLLISAVIMPWTMILTPLAQSMAGETPTYSEHIKPIIDNHCVGCHQEGGIAPFVLTHYESVTRRAKRIADAVANGRMPPWPADPYCNEYKNDRSLSQQQVKTIMAWAYGGSPRGEPVTPAKNASNYQFARPGVNLTIRMPEPYTPKTHPDEYRCFVFDYPDQADRFITGFGVAPGNPSIVHHLIAYLIPPEGAAKAAELEARDPGLGYTCFGEPGIDSATWLGGWAPGTQWVSYPKGTGLEVKAGSKVILQMHYHLGTHLRERFPSDQSAILLGTASHVEKVGAMIPWSNPEWVYRPERMLIPAGDANVHHGVSADVAGLMGTRVDIHGAMLHMHQLGREIMLSVPDETERQCLARVPKWDFQWQLIYWFERPRRMHVGEKLQLDCYWDNSLGNQPFEFGRRMKPRDVTWGDGSRDEMCLAILYVTPAGPR